MQVTLSTTLILVILCVMLHYEAMRLLQFTIGLEFSLDRLWTLRKHVFELGGVARAQNFDNSTAVWRSRS